MQAIRQNGELLAENWVNGKVNGWRQLNAVMSDGCSSMSSGAAYLTDLTDFGKGARAIISRGWIVQPAFGPPRHYRQHSAPRKYQQRTK